MGADGKDLVRVGEMEGKNETSEVLEKQCMKPEEERMKPGEEKKENGRENVTGRSI